MRLVVVGDFLVCLSCFGGCVHAYGVHGFGGVRDVTRGRDPQRPNQTKRHKTHHIRTSYLGAEPHAQAVGGEDDEEHAGQPPRDGGAALDAHALRPVLYMIHMSGMLWKSKSGIMIVDHQSIDLPTQSPTTPTIHPPTPNPKTTTITTTTTNPIPSIYFDKNPPLQLHRIPVRLLPLPRERRHRPNARNRLLGDRPGLRIERLAQRRELPDGAEERGGGETEEGHNAAHDKGKLPAVVWCWWLVL